MAPLNQWARLKADVTCDLRRGAWYKVIKLAAVQAVVDIKGKAIAIPREALQLSPTRPPRWSVVPSPKAARRYPPTWGPKYAVCPNCRDRAALVGRPANLRCARCNQVFDVAWDEPYLS